MKTVFVGGVHGVGKTYLSAQVASLRSISHFSASQIIRNQATQELLRADKSVLNIDRNQILLLEGLRELARQIPALLLDGHFVLRTGPSVFAPVPYSIFEGIAPIAIILLKAEIDTIHGRLQNKGAPFEKAFIRDLQIAEETEAQRTANLLSVPLTTLNEPTSDEFLRVLDRNFGL